MNKLILNCVRVLLIADGFIAGMPQIARMVVRGSSADVSIASWAWMFVMACLWAQQGKHDKSAITFWGSMVWAINNATVVVVAIVYRAHALP